MRRMRGSIPLRADSRLELPCRPPANPNQADKGLRSPCASRRPPLTPELMCLLKTERLRARLHRPVAIHAPTDPSTSSYCCCLPPNLIPTEPSTCIHAAPWLHHPGKFVCLFSEPSSAPLHRTDYPVEG